MSALRHKFVQERATRRIERHAETRSSCACRAARHRCAGRPCRSAVSNQADQVGGAYPPAGTTDVLARIVAQWLSENIGQQVVVENKPGAGNNIGTEFANTSATRRLHHAAGEPGQRHQCLAL
jgi:hypothetical protein